MEKPLSLGPRLVYPITVSKLLKRPGDTIKKQEALLQYKFTWMKLVGDPIRENEWEEEQTTYGTWDSPTDGTLKSWKVEEGMKIAGDMVFCGIEEDCPHSIQFAGLCGMCGKDMTETSWSSTSNDTERAKINMIHDQNFLTVSQGEASKAEEELQRRLLKHRKLSLVVDLDQTIIHACIEPTVGEWQRDSTSPNYDAVKEVRSFQLNDDGPRGLASGCWYYIKMRPGLKDFLAKVSEIYELHVYTMGTRAYALNIAKIVDPDKKLFGDRIISRDENGNVTAKSLARLFPVDTKMVVIIDDRADVWPKNRPNLIKVVPYDFFLGIGDINSSFLPKREELPKVEPPKKALLENSDQASDPKAGESTEKDTPGVDSSAEKGNADVSIEESMSPEVKVSALEELVRMGGGDDQALRLEQAEEQKKFLEKQLTERPLLHMQEKLDKEDSEEEAAIIDVDNVTESTNEHPHSRHNLLKDDDVELIYLEQHLTQLHKAFYDEYDSFRLSSQGGRVAQLKRPGHHKKVAVKDDLTLVPDIGEVMPNLKSRTLAGTIIVTSGLVPLGIDAMRSEIVLQATSFGADVRTKVSRKVTHLVASSDRTRTQKVRQATKYPHIKIVNQQWLINSMSKWVKEDEAPYLIEISDRDRTESQGSSIASVLDSLGSDDSEDESLSEDDDDEGVPNSQDEEQDDEGVMPEDIEGGRSPIDDLKGFDWGTVDDELAEFMGSDSENDSDTNSVASDSSSRSQTEGGRKRKLQDATEDDESEEESSLAKKQRIANARTTSLKSVKTPNSTHSESSLPTPGPTADERDDEVESATAKSDSMDFDEDELEADLEAEFAREELEGGWDDGKT